MKLSKRLVVALLLSSASSRPVVDSVKELVSHAPTMGYIKNKIDRMDALKPKLESAQDQINEIMKDPPADADIPEAKFAPKSEVIEAPIPSPKVSKSCDCEEDEQPACCGKAVTTITKHHKNGKKHHTHIIHDSPSEMTSDEKGLAAIAKTAIEVMGRPEPIDSLARRAQENIQNNGVSDEVRHMAKKALANQEGGDIQDMAKRALDNLNNGKAVGGDIQEMAKKALDNLNNGKAGAPDGIQELAKKALDNMDK